MNALHEQFIVEARELVHQATADLIAAEREGFSDDRIDRVFRAFHTLKGSAGVVEIPAMIHALHAAEDVLAAIQAGRVGANSVVIDQVLACLDQVSKWVDDFEVNAALASDAGEAARDVAERLQALIIASGLVGPRGASSAGQAGNVLPDWVNRLIESEQANIPDDVHGQAAELFAVCYEPNAGCFYNGDDPFELMRRVPKLLVLRTEPREPWPPVADLDPFACNLRLQGISAAAQAELAAVFRLVPDQVRIAAIPSAALPRPAAPKDDDAALVRAVIEEQRQVLRASGGAPQHAARAGSAVRSAANALRYGRCIDEAERIEHAAIAAIAASEPALLLSAIDETLRALDPDQTAAGFESIEAAVGSKTEAPATSVSRAIRVAEAKIDALVDLAGELLVVKNAFAHLARQAESETAGRELGRAIRSQHDAIERLAGELHAAIMQLRMVPVAQVFRSFPRLVRDVSQRLRKNVSLVTRGETTETDKTIADLLFEPLMHLVRNALDHGIEPPEQRRAAGKPEGATITLQASKMGDRFLLDVIDDGRGIDPALVRLISAERKLLPAADLAALSDEQALDLVFSAGFSTTSEVSDISGRGVGMDVVRTTVERIGGRVSLQSRVGVGTKVRLDLPMNIALLRIMVVEAGGQVFGIPMDAVSETVRLTPDRISRIKNNDGFVLRGRIVPICSLAELMNLPPSKAAEPGVRLVVVAEIAGRVAALEVDAIRDRLEVVLKPMQGLLSNARGYSGTTLLGDGAVLLVLDLKEIVP